jgi:hypothetical protein
MELPIQNHSGRVALYLVIGFSYVGGIIPGIGLVLMALWF